MTPRSPAWVSQVWRATGADPLVVVEAMRAISHGGPPRGPRSALRPRGRPRHHPPPDWPARRAEPKGADGGVGDRGRVRVRPPGTCHGSRRGGSEFLPACV